MKINFTKKHLEELYTEGKTKNKKYRFQPSIIKRYIQAIDKLKAANRIEDLFLIKSLNYEKLTGKKKELESVRVNNQYRIEFKSHLSGEPPDVITVCDIIELSNHYN